MRHGQNCKFQHFWNTPLSKVGKSWQKLSKIGQKMVKKLSKKLSKSCQKVVTNFVSPGKNQKKVNRPENKN
jgi:hypothetical protein